MNGNTGLRWVLALGVLAVLGWGLLWIQPDPPPAPRPGPEPVAESPVIPEKAPVSSGIDDDGDETAEIVLSTRQNPTATGIPLDFRELTLQVKVEGPAVPWRTRSAGMLQNLPVVVEITATREGGNPLHGLQFTATDESGGKAGLVARTFSTMAEGDKTVPVKLTVQLPEKSSTGYLNLQYRSLNGKKLYRAVVRLP